ncbi:hypothetical protein Tco_1054819 [Tanacetum coccineum]|uniref:Uncharacterized protein n=1 Tax=Tanacetum coccineum TaxID=301880 RepID=A0ABQ5GXV9_9ASTR
MASSITRFDIEKLDRIIVQKHGGSKQVELKQLCSKQVGFKQIDVKQVGFKQLSPGVETGVHRVQDEKRVWFEVELQGAQGNHEAEVFQVSNDDAAVAQRWLEDKQLEKKDKHRLLGKGAGKEGNVAGRKKRRSKEAKLKNLLKYKAWLTRRSPVRGSSIE